MFNKPKAHVIDWKYKWSSGAPCPHVISSGHSTYLVYYALENAPSWDGADTKVIDPDKDEQLPLVLVEFTKCYLYKFGGANDEVFHGLPLWNIGLKPYEAHLVSNSGWIKEEKKIQKVHSCFSDEVWSKKKHYVLLFHDELFECIADGYELEVFKDTFKNVTKTALDRCFGNDND